MSFLCTHKPASNQLDLSPRAVLFAEAYAYFPSLALQFSGFEIIPWPSLCLKESISTFQFQRLHHYLSCYSELRSACNQATEQQRTKKSKAQSLILKSMFVDMGSRWLRSSEAGSLVPFTAHMIWQSIKQLLHETVYCPCTQVYTTLPQFPLLHDGSEF